MKTIKLIVTHGGALERKYGVGGLERIMDAITELARADEARGFTTMFVRLDEADETNPYGVSALTGKATALRCKRVIDRLWKVLKPDYLVLLGAADVLPHFEVPNPSYKPVDGDDDRLVPTDNPYACSRAFSSKKRETYLIPDRVVGRVPDLPGGTDPAWLLDPLDVARSWASRSARSYDKDLMVCCDAWREAGEDVAKYLSRDTKTVFVAPPSLYSNSSHPPILAQAYENRLHLIKCHGAQLDTMYYGQKRNNYPPVLTSGALAGRTRPGTVVGAMCCYGAALFDPTDPRVNADVAGDPPIPSIYLRQGAYGFVGSTTIAWVGTRSMQCADWMIGAFAHYVLEGASTGRALLDSKQEFVRWIQQQGRSPDICDEKTLLQFLLLGDPSIHPVAAPGETAGAEFVEGVPVAAGRAFERRRRRSFRRVTGEELRKSLPSRSKVRQGFESLDRAPALLDRLGTTFRESIAGDGEGWTLDEEPLVYTVGSSVPRTDARHDVAVVAAATGEVAELAPIVAGETLQYYWTARRRTERVVDARLMKVETDHDGAVLRTQLLVTG